VPPRPDHPRQGQGLTEGAGGVHRVLAEHGIHHEQGLDGLHRGVEGLDLRHHGLVDGQAAGRIHQHYVVVVLAGVIHGGQSDVHRRVGGFRREEVHPRLLRDSLQLGDGRRPIDVGGYRQDLLLHALPQELAQLAGGGGLAGPLQTCHENDGRGLGGQIEAGVGAAHQCRELPVHHPHQGLARR